MLLRSEKPRSKPTAWFEDIAFSVSTHSRTFPYGHTKCNFKDLAKYYFIDGNHLLLQDEGLLGDANSQLCHSAQQESCRANTELPSDVTVCQIRLPALCDVTGIPEELPSFLHRNLLVSEMCALGQCSLVGRRPAVIPPMMERPRPRARIRHRYGHAVETAAAEKITEALAAVFTSECGASRGSDGGPGSSSSKRKLVRISSIVRSTPLPMSPLFNGDPVKSIVLAYFTLGPDEIRHVPSHLPSHLSATPSAIIREP